MTARSPEIVLVRHGATAWSPTGRHTGRADIPLTDEGRASAATLPARLSAWMFGTVLVSPLQRAVETCAIAGYADRATGVDDLMEWNYGELEGLTLAEWHVTHPSWDMWQQGCPGGETVAQVGDRANRVIGRLDGDGAGADTLVIAHGHLLRVLAMRWTGLPAHRARSFALDTGALGVLGWDRAERMLLRWNLTTALPVA